MYPDVFQSLLCSGYFQDFCQKDFEAVNAILWKSEFDDGKLTPEQSINGDPMRTWQISRLGLAILLDNEQQVAKQLPDAKINAGVCVIGDIAYTALELALRVSATDCYAPMIQHWPKAHERPEMFLRALAAAESSHSTYPLWYFLASAMPLSPQSIKKEDDAEWVIALMKKYVRDRNWAVVALLSKKVAAGLSEPRQYQVSMILWKVRFPLTQWKATVCKTVAVQPEVMYQHIRGPYRHVYGDIMRGEFQGHTTFEDRIDALVFFGDHEELVKAFSHQSIRRDDDLKSSHFYRDMVRDTTWFHTILINMPTVDCLQACYHFHPAAMLQALGKLAPTPLAAKFQWVVSAELREWAMGVAQKHKNIPLLLTLFELVLPDVDIMYSLGLDGYEWWQTQVLTLEHSTAEAVLKAALLSVLTRQCSYVHIRPDKADRFYETLLNNLYNSLSLEDANKRELCVNTLSDAATLPTGSTLSDKVLKKFIDRCLNNLVAADKAELIAAIKGENTRVAHTLNHALQGTVQASMVMRYEAIQAEQAAELMPMSEVVGEMAKCQKQSP